MKKVVVVGGGVAGCGAAAAAKRAGADVILLERSEVLGGLALRGGSYRMSGQYTAHEELVAMGGGDVVNAMDAEKIYENRELPGQMHVYLYNCKTFDKRLLSVMKDLGVDVRFLTRVHNVVKEDNMIKSVVLQDKQEINADAFVDATGTFGPEGNCRKYGAGCIMCYMRCPTYGGRISLSARAGVKEKVGKRRDGVTIGSYSAAFTLVEESLSPELQKILKKEGSYLPKIPSHLVESIAEKIKLVAPAVTPDHAEILTLTRMGDGMINIVGIPYMTTEELQQISGFENAVLDQPYSGWLGNSVRYMAIAPRDERLKVDGIENLFVAGEKIGGSPNGVTECVFTGVLAGHNAVRKAADKELLTIPRTTTIGDFIAYTAEKQDDLATRYAVIWGIYFERMKELGMYTKDVNEIQNRVKEAGVSGIFSEVLT